MRIAFRVNVDPDTGYGHIFRCLNLAGKLREAGHEAVFLSNPNELVDGYESVFISESVGSEVELAATQKHLANIAPDALLLDIFPEEKRAPGNYAELVGWTGHTVSFVDSDDDFAPDSGLTVNPNPLYKGHLVHENCFCGPDYFLVNPEFKRENLKGNSAFVSMGSVDENDDLPGILEALSRYGSQNVDILASPFASYIDRLDEIFSRFPQMEITWHEKVPSAALGRLIDRADICITNGGNVMMEMMFLLKKVVSIPSNERLTHLTRWYAERNGVLECENVAELYSSLGRIDGFTPTELIDGRGLERITDLIVNNR